MRSPGLLDVLPMGYREQAKARRYPIALAVMGRHHSEAVAKGARRGCRMIRKELAGQLPAHEAGALLDACAVEGAKLAVTARAAVLAERALCGELFTPHL